MDVVIADNVVSMLEAVAVATEIEDDVEVTTEIVLMMLPEHPPLQLVIVSVSVLTSVVVELLFVELESTVEKGNTEVIVGESRVVDVTEMPDPRIEL